MQSFTAFAAAGATEREDMCRALERTILARLQGVKDFNAAVKEAVQLLRGLGHDLWSFDEHDELEVWCPDWSAKSSRGLTIRFAPSEIEVSWFEKTSGF